MLHNIDLLLGFVTAIAHCKGTLGKGTFLYIAVSSPWDCSKRFTLHPLADLVSGKHSATLQLLREDYSFRCPPLSVARYSFTQLNELWQHEMNEIAKPSKWQQEDSNPGSLD